MIRPRGRARRARLGYALALGVLVAAALATPLGGRAFGRACAAGTVHVAIIVDAGSGNSVSALCVAASAGENGESLLSARASMLGTPQPRYNGSGLLCAIDGFPATGCGVAHDGHFAYWSYWHGRGGNWSFSNAGPGTTQVSPTVVEGWRWEPDGVANPSDPPPRGPATATSVCVPAPPPTTARPPAVTPQTVTPTTAPAPGITGVAGQSSPPVTVGPAGTGTRTTNLVNSTVATSTTPRAGNAVAPTTARGRSPAGDSASSSVALVPLGIAAPATPHSSGGAPIGAIIAAALVLALGGAGFVTARRRRAA